MTLREFFTEHPEAAIAFSGGVDSALLLWAAARYAQRARAYFIQTPFQPAFELADAKRLAEDVGAPLTVIPFDVLSVPEAAENGPQRCYYCKKALFSRILEAARADGFSLVLDGTNASDDAGDRPGMRALGELSVRSPLRECGLTKEDVRRLSREAGLFTWNKPAYACLATRVPEGTPIARETLQKIEQAEDALSELGFTDFRVRVLGDKARLQVTREQLPLVLETREAVLGRLGGLFSAVLLDLAPRSPSR